MLDIFYLAWRYLAYHKIKSALLILSITLILFLPAGLKIVRAPWPARIDAVASIGLLAQIRPLGRYDRSRRVHQCRWTRCIQRQKRPASIGPCLATFRPGMIVSCKGAWVRFSVSTFTLTPALANSRENSHMCRSTPPCVSGQ